MSYDMHIDAFYKAIIIIGIPYKVYLALQDYDDDIKLFFI